jgi:hypothetical protein
LNQREEECFVFTPLGVPYKYRSPSTIIYGILLAQLNMISIYVTLLRFHREEGLVSKKKIQTIPKAQRFWHAFLTWEM